MFFLEYLLALVVFFMVNDVSGEYKGLVNPAERRKMFKQECFPPSQNGPLDCGGTQVRNDENEGKCGECGDIHNLPRPRPNENGGTYGRGFIAGTYQAGSKFFALVDLGSFHHSGFFDFALCPLNTTTDMETEKCFDEHKLKFVNGQYRFDVEPSEQRFFTVEVHLPEGLTCQHCVLRWQYSTERYAQCPDRSFDPKCGPQDYIRSCSDIMIQ